MAKHGAAYVLAIGLLLGSSVPVARASTFAGALETTQIANFFQALEQAARTARQLENMKRRLEHIRRQAQRFSDSDFRNVWGVTRSFFSLHRSIARLYYSGARLADRFDDLFPGEKPEWHEYRHQMTRLEHETRESTRRALKQMELTFEQAESDEVLYESFKEKLQRDELGQNELLEIGDRLLLEILAQLQQLKSVFAGFAHMEAVHRATVNQKRQYRAAHTKDLLRGTMSISREARSWGRTIQRWGR